MNLNLGCGSRFHKDWINIDFFCIDPNVRAHNLLRGIPLPCSCVDIVYHSHLLEHFSRNRAGHLLAECMRVLKPGGIIRVVVPDLEKIVTIYLASLNSARANTDEGKAHYEWMIIELLDQLVREQSGGEMLMYLSSYPLPAKEFVLNRLGIEATRIIESSQNKKDDDTNKITVKLFNHLKKLIICIKNSRFHVASVLSGIDYTSIMSAKFRSSGEVHKWMYDAYYLKNILETTGFRDVVVRGADESYISNWSTYNLDTEPDGSIYKPDSIWMEGIKPS